MKRALLSALVMGVFALFSGCEDTSKEKVKETSTGPGGSTTTTVEKKVESSGSNPPPNTAGETGKTGVAK